MLLVLLKRLIIYVNKLAKLGYVPEKQEMKRFHTVRSSISW